MMKKGIVAVLMLATVPFFFGTAPRARAYTSPGKPTGYVNDFAGIISADHKAGLEETLADFEKRTGDEIAVVTVPTIGDETIESYAEKLFQEWGIGKQNKDNGLLLLVAYQERKIRIEVGYGLEEYMTDAQASSIIRNTLTPAFKKGDYSSGISQAVSQIAGVLEQDPTAIAETNSNNSPDYEGGFVGILYFLFIIPIWLGSAMARSKSWWAGGVVGLVTAIFFGYYFGMFFGIIAFIIFVPFGLAFDYFVSKAYADSMLRNQRPPWWIGGRGFGGRGGGGFGGFGGGGSGGGGASGGW